MKSFLVSLAFFLSGMLLSFGQQNISNPLSLGIILVNQTSVDRMDELCQWYKLTEQPSDDGFHVFRHDDGTLIKFNMSEDKIPYVEIHTSQNKKNIEKTITEAGFNKDKGLYVKGSVHAIKYTTAKILGNRNKRVIFTIQKPKYQEINNEKR